MRSIQPTRRRRPASYWLGLLLIGLLTVGGVLGVLLLLGVNLNPFAGTGEDPFMVRIPINSQPIPAYERVTREHLLNPSTGGLMYQRVPPQSAIGMSIIGVTSDGSLVESRVESIRNVNDRVVFVVTDGRELSQGQTLQLGGALMNINAILGRVVKRDKRAGMGFQESTFFPQGTPEGIAGATPPGMRAVTLDATKLTGVYALNAGDKIDLMASVPTAELGSFQSQPPTSLPAALLTFSNASESSKSAAEPVLLAQAAVVLKPVYVRQEATTSASLTQGKRIQNVPKYEVTIAVAPDDIVPLQSALNQSLKITCIAHSMQPEKATPVSIPEVQDELLAPVTVRPILAYGVVTREAFVSAATRRVRMAPVSRQQADRLGIVLSINDALGAVARHDIPAGSFIRTKDLMNGSLREAEDEDIESAPNIREVRIPGSPFHFVSQPTDHAHAHEQTSPASTGASVVGDRPAVTSFIPPGRVAIAVPWNLLYGAEHLQIDDRVDIIASYQLERVLERSGTTTETRVDGGVVDVTKTDFEEYGDPKTDRTISESIGLRGEPWHVSTDAIVVGPVGFPAPNAALRAIGDIGNATNREGALSGPAILFAVDNRDVESLTTALNTRDVLFSVTFRAKTTGETPKGYKRIAVAPVEIPAFELFSELNWRGLRREITTRLVREDDANFRGALLASEIADYYGRVLKAAKLRFAHFTANDFMPAGISSREALLSQAYIVSRSSQPDTAWKRIAVAPTSLPAFELFSDLAVGPAFPTRIVPTDDERFSNAISAAEITEFYGRVLRNAKPQFEHFTAQDFLPAGISAQEAKLSQAYIASRSGQPDTTWKRIAVAPAELPAFALFSDISFGPDKVGFAMRVVPADDERFSNAISASEITEFYGRVLTSNKQRLEHFTSDDFLPAGITPEEAKLSQAYIASRSGQPDITWKRIAVAPADLSSFTLFSDMSLVADKAGLATRVVPADDERFSNAISAAEITEFYGRVLRNAKPQFEHFTAQDFLPVGVKPGVAASLGNASVAIDVSTDDIAGLDRFADNDHVAIILTGNPQLPVNAILHGTERFGATGEVIVQNARIVRSGAKSGQATTLEIPIAEATKFTAVLRSETSNRNLLAVALARDVDAQQPSATTNRSVIPDHDPVRSAAKIEAIVGRKTETHIFAGGNMETR